MEEQLERLNNKLSHKRTDYIVIYGACNSNGVITQVFSETMKYSEDYDYYVSLITAELVFFFPNIIEGKNNIFTIRILTIKIKSYNSQVELMK